MKLVDLPSSIHPPAGHKPDKKWRRARRQATRREFIRLATRAGVGTGLAFAALMPTARRAYATHETPALYWPQSPSDKCYGPPGHALVAGTGCCRCGSNVTDQYCNSEDWHLHHTQNPDPNVKIYYKLREQSCGKGVSKNQRRNAWIWRVSGTDWRCSDGERKYCWSDNGGQWECEAWRDTVCPAIV